MICTLLKTSKEGTAGFSVPSESEVPLLQIMGILNVTPDSFSDGGQYNSIDRALARAAEMIAEGVSIIDVGGESTRPGATFVSPSEEYDRVIPIIDAIKREFSIALSVDTSQPEVITAALDLSVDMINDVRALSLPGALTAVAIHKHPANICLMHAPLVDYTLSDKAAIFTMQADLLTKIKTKEFSEQSATLTCLIPNIKAFLTERISACFNAGIARDRLIIDPGFGFGKTFHENSYLLRHLDELQSLKQPILVGLSRKTTVIGNVLNLPVNERLYASLSLAVLAVAKGARYIRTHDVKPTREAVEMARAILTEA